jgi:hypothetical protein
MKQLFQMDKIVVGRFRLHNLYAFLPSYGYSWDRLESEITPSGDPTHLSDRRIAGAAWFFKLVSFFPLMYFCLFVSMLIFAGEMTDASTENKLEIYVRVALGLTFIFFLWLVRSMRSCDELMRTAFRARRIGVESPWPTFPPQSGASKSKAQRWGGRGLTSAAALVSLVNLFMFLAWSVPRVPKIALGLPEWLIGLGTRDHYWVWFGLLGMAIFVVCGYSMEQRTRAVRRTSRATWPSPRKAIRRVNTYWVPPSFGGKSQDPAAPQ